MGWVGGAGWVGGRQACRQRAGGLPAGRDPRCGAPCAQRMCTRAPHSLAGDGGDAPLQHAPPDLRVARPPARQEERAARAQLVQHAAQGPHVCVHWSAGGGWLETCGRCSAQSSCSAQPGARASAAQRAGGAGGWAGGRARTAQAWLAGRRAHEPQGVHPPATPPASAHPPSSCRAGRARPLEQRTEACPSAGGEGVRWAWGRAVWSRRLTPGPGRASARRPGGAPRQRAAARRRSMGRVDGRGAAQGGAGASLAGAASHQHPSEHVVQHLPGWRGVGGGAAGG